MALPPFLTAWRRWIAPLTLVVAVSGPASVSLAGVTSPALVSSAVVGQGFGTIKGRLVYGGEGLPTPKVLVKKDDPSAKDSAVCAVNGVVSKAMTVDPKTKGIEFGVAYIVAPKGKNAEMEAALLAKTPNAEIDQRGCEFFPHVTTMHKNQSLVFKSSDPVPHNVHYTAFTNGDLNQMLAPNGQLTQKFASAEKRASKLVCDIHPWMEAYFFIFDHPFYATTKADGSFEIKGVPAGTQNIVVWHETGYVTPGLAKGMPVEVKAGEVSDVGEIKLIPKK